MDQNSPPPGDIPERPMGETPPESPQSPGAYSPPPGGYAPPPGGYAPPPQQGYGQQPGAQAGAPPPGYQPQGYPPPGYTQPGAPAPGGYPPPGTPQGYPPPGYGPPPKRSGMPVWAWVLIGLVVVLIVGCIGIIAALGLVANKAISTFSSVSVDILNNLEPLTVSTLFYSSLESKDYQSAHAMLSTDLASKFSAADLQARWEALQAAQGNVSAAPVTTGGGINSTSSTASIDEQLTSANGKSYKVTVQLGKTGNDWRITGATPDLIPSP